MPYLHVRFLLNTESSLSQIRDADGIPLTVDDFVAEELPTEHCNRAWETGSSQDSLPAHITESSEKPEIRLQPYDSLSGDRVALFFYPFFYYYENNSHNMNCWKKHKINIHQSIRLRLPFDFFCFSFIISCESSHSCQFRTSFPEKICLEP